VHQGGVDRRLHKQRDIELVVGGGELREDAVGHERFSRWRGQEGPA
jgi:hypothetical protein